MPSRAACEPSSAAAGSRSAAIASRSSGALGPAAAAAARDRQWRIRSPKAAHGPARRDAAPSRSAAAGESSPQKASSSCCDQPPRCVQSQHLASRRALLRQEQQQQRCGAPTGGAPESSARMTQTARHQTHAVYPVASGAATVERTSRRRRWRLGRARPRTSAGAAGAAARRTASLPALTTLPMTAQSCSAPRSCWPHRSEAARRSSRPS